MREERERRQTHKLSCDDRPEHCPVLSVEDEDGEGADDVENGLKFVALDENAALGNHCMPQQHTLHPENGSHIWSKEECKKGGIRGKRVR